MLSVLLSELAVEAEFLTGPVIRPVSKAWLPLVSLTHSLPRPRDRSRTFLLSQIPNIGFYRGGEKISLEVPFGLFVVFFSSLLVVRENPFFFHSDSETFFKTTFLTKPSGVEINCTVIGKCTIEVLKIFRLQV